MADFLKSLTSAPTRKTLGFVLKVPEGDIRFSAEEGKYYTRVFQIVDADNDQQIGGADGAAFLRRANLPNELLREIWRIASGGKSRPFLGKEHWFVAMKLVALAQQTNQVSLEPLVMGHPLPLPDFGMDSVVDNQALSAAAAAPVGADLVAADQPTQFEIRVLTPITRGSGMSKYTEYTLHTQTTLESFPRSEMQVVRRYSDMRWAHKCMTSKFPGTIMPPLPEKRYWNMDPQFVEERRLALEHYLNKVAAHPKLSRSYHLQMLLDASREGLDAAKAMSEGDLRENSGAEASSDWLGNMMGGVKKGLGMDSTPPVELNPDPNYLRVNTRIQTSDLRINAATEATQKQLTLSKGVAYEMSRAAVYLSSIGAFEHTLLGPSEWNTTGAAAAAGGPGSSLPTGIAPRGSLATYLEHQALDSSSQASPLTMVGRWRGGNIDSSAILFAETGRAMEAIADVNQDGVDRQIAVFLTPLRYQVGRVKSVKDVLAHRNRAVRELQAASASLHSHKRNYASARASGAGGTVYGSTVGGGGAEQAENSRRGVEQAEQRIRDSETQIALIAQNLKDEMATYDVLKVREFKELLRASAQTQVEYSRKTRLAWEHVLMWLNASPAELARSRARIAVEVPEALRGSAESAQDEAAATLGSSSWW